MPDNKKNLEELKKEASARTRALEVMVGGGLGGLLGLGLSPRDSEDVDKAQLALAGAALGGLSSVGLSATLRKIRSMKNPTMKDVHALFAQETKLRHPFGSMYQKQVPERVKEVKRTSDALDKAKMLGGKRHPAVIRAETQFSAAQKALDEARALLEPDRLNPMSVGSRERKFMVTKAYRDAHLRALNALPWGVGKIK